MHPILPLPLYTIIMGVTASMMSLVWTIAPMISGVLQPINIFLPLIFSCVILALVTLLTAKFSLIGFDEAYVTTRTPVIAKQANATRSKVTGSLRRDAPRDDWSEQLQ